MRLCLYDPNGRRRGVFCILFGFAELLEEDYETG